MTRRTIAHITAAGVAVAGPPFAGIQISGGEGPDLIVGEFLRQEPVPLATLKCGFTWLNSKCKTHPDADHACDLDAGHGESDFTQERPHRCGLCHKCGCPEAWSIGPMTASNPPSRKPASKFHMIMWGCYHNHEPFPRSIHWTSGTANDHADQQVDHVDVRAVVIDGEPKP